MKLNKLLVITAMVFASVFAANAQSARTQNEGVVAITYLRQDVKFVQPKLAFDENTDSLGFSASYTRYTSGEKGKVGVLGLTGEVGANFDSNNASLVTAMVGVTAKARNSSVVQPYIKVLGGVAREHVGRKNILDTTDVSAAFNAGTGLDIAFSKHSRYGVRLGADYIRSGFNGAGQNAAKLSLGLVF